jgi:hypothetical protein
MNNKQILEYVESGIIRPERIDRAAGIIRGVKLLGPKSANPPPHNNEYPLEMRQRSTGILEGGRIYVNHPGRADAGQTRPYEEAMGVARNVRESGDGLVGDWHFPPKHPLAESVCWDAQNNPTGLAFSINATAGKIRFENGRKIIESLEALHSIDLVSRGATTRSLFEGLRARESRRDPPARPAALPGLPVRLSGILAARLEAVDRCISAGKYSKRLCESLCNAATEREIERLLDRAGVIVVPSWVRDGRTLARWSTS